MRGYWLGMFREVLHGFYFRKRGKKLILFPLSCYDKQRCKECALYICCLWCSNVIPLYKVLKGIYLELFIYLMRYYFYIFKLHLSGYGKYFLITNVINTE